MASEDVNLSLGAHVPDARHGISARGDEDVESGMEGQRIDARERAMVLPYDLVSLKVPTLDHFVLATGKEVWVPRRHGQASHRRDVAGERELELARSQVPDLRDMIYQQPFLFRARLPQANVEDLTLIIRSPAPVANHLLPGSTATHRTHPRCPLMTLDSFH